MNTMHMAEKYEHISVHEHLQRYVATSETDYFFIQCLLIHRVILSICIYWEEIRERERVSDKQIFIQTEGKRERLIKKLTKDRWLSDTDNLKVLTEPEKRKQSDRHTCRHKIPDRQTQNTRQTDNT